MSSTTSPENGRSNRLTIRQVADLAGVSTATVSRVINGRTEVSDRAREAVLRVVREHGYSTNRTARGLSAGRTGLVGVTTPVVHHSYFAVILDGAGEALYEQDMRIVLCPTLHEHEREVTLLDRLMHGTTDGALLMLPSESSTELKALTERGYPFVVIDPMEPLDEGIASVAAANASGAKAATEHLLALGHVHIGAIIGPPSWLASRERVNGFHAALAGAGIAPDRSLEIPSDFEIGGGYAAAAKLLDRPDRPTAIFGFNDNIAIGVIRAARERGIRIPEDISLVGFDDAEEAMLVTPTLTTVRQPLQEMGRMGVSLLSRLLEGQAVEALRVELATKLVVRESTAPPATP
jgi:LacI family transcriptional regulator